MNKFYVCIPLNISYLFCPTYHLLNFLCDLSVTVLAYFVLKIDKKVSKTLLKMIPEVVFIKLLVFVVDAWAT